MPIDGSPSTEGPMEPTADDVFAQTGEPGSEGSGLGGEMEAGPEAGAGPGGPEPEPGLAAQGEGRGPGGPTGSQDSSGGDLAEAGG